MDILGLPDWVIWGLIAALLLAVEMISTAYIALGFAVGAAVAGLVVFLLPGLPVVVQALTWAGMGLGVWLVLSRRNRIRHALRPDINDFDPIESLPRSDRARREAQRRMDNPPD